MPLIKLGNYYRQPSPTACHQTCTKMVLDYAIDVLKIYQKKLAIKTIATAIGSNQMGTSPSRIEDINFILKDSLPPIKFKVIEPATFVAIEQEIQPNKGIPKPVIAWINVLNDNDGIPWHVVIVNGYSDDRKEIYYIDPIFDEEHAQKRVDLGTFIQYKLGRTGRLVVLVISEDGQRDLLGNVLHPKKRRRSKK